MFAFQVSGLGMESQMRKKSSKLSNTLSIEVRTCGIRQTSMGHVGVISVSLLFNQLIIYFS